MHPFPPSRGAWPHALALLLLASLACVKRPVDYEREYARTLAPKARAEQPATESARREAPPRRVVRVRFYADALYRSQVLHWEKDLGERLRRATQGVERELGVVFELDSARPWTRTSGRPDLDAALEELEAHDAGEDVDLVVGLLPALQVFTASHADLGRARSFGRHAVLRGMENPDEHQQILRVLRHLPAAEQDTLYRERKLHKENSVLLHEWAHTLGAPHESDSHWTMSPLYEVTQQGFSPATLQLLAASLRHLPQARRDPEVRRAWAQALQQVLTTTPWPAWEGPEKVEALAWAARVLDGKEPLEREPPQQLSAADRRRFEEVLAHDRAGRIEVAAQALERLVPLYPRNEQVQVMACYLGTRVAPKQPTTRERCAAAETAFPTQASASLNLGQLRLLAGDAAGAQPHLVEARARLQAAPAVDPAAWGHLAGLLQGASCVTWAEEAVANAKGAAGTAEVARWAARTRTWTGLPAAPARGSVAPEQEGAFVRRVREVEAQLERQALAQARASVARLEKDFPGAPVVHQLQCEALVRSMQPVPARAACRRALAAQEGLVQAHFLLGWLADAEGKGSEARAELERALALDPAHPGPWRILAKQYRAGGLSAELAALRARYRAQFAQELP